MSMKGLTPAQQEEVERAFAANRAFQESLVKDHVPGRAEFKLVLVQAPGDQPIFSPTVQAELLNTKRAIEAQGVEVSGFPYMVMDSVGGGGGAVGEYIIPLTAALAPIITGVAGAWLHGLFGRKVRVEFYESGQLKKLDANTADDVSSIMELAARLGEPRLLKSPE